MEKIIFLDRDGTINADESGYISSPEDFNLYPNVGKAIHNFNKLGYKIVVVTNQSGIARGYYGFKELELIHEKMIRLIEADGGVIEDILIAPYHKDGVIEPYNIEHEDRKPCTGLLKTYNKKSNFATSKSFMIGDKLSDIEFGFNFNLKTILVLTGNGKNTFEKSLNSDIKADFIVKDLLSAAKLIEKLNKK